eukprot:5840589-Heterocapsa_arctica.AAC.1
MSFRWPLRACSLDGMDRSGFATVITLVAFRLMSSSVAVMDLITTPGKPSGLCPAVAGCCVDVRQCRLPLARTTGS